MLGIGERTFRRWRDRFEEEGEAGLVDRRLGRPSQKRAPAIEIERMLGLFRDKYADFTVKKELRVAGIATVAEAKAWLRETYRAEHNRKFAIEPLEEGSALVADKAEVWREVCASWRSAALAKTTRRRGMGGACKSRRAGSGPTSSKPRSGCTKTRTGPRPCSWGLPSWRGSTPGARK